MDSAGGLLSRLRQAGGLVWAPVLAAIGVLLAAKWIMDVEPARVAIRVDLELSGGSSAEIFLNGSDEPFRVRAAPGRQVYEFSVPPTVIKTVRIDPADAADIEIRLHAINIIGADGRELARFDPGALSNWIRKGVEVVGVGSGGLHLRSTEADPMLIGTIGPISAVERASVRAAIKARLQRDPWLLCILVLPLFSLIEFKPIDAWLRRALVAIAVVALWPLVYDTVSAMDWGSTPSTVAVSKAAFFGVSLPSIQAGIVAGFAAAGVMGLAFALWRRPRAVDAGDAQVPTYPRWFLPLLVAVIAIVTAPDLAGTAGWFKTMQYQPHWDYDNVLYWAFWTAHDALPMRDFWYPYGGLFLFDLAWPTGPFIAWAAEVGRYSIFAVALMLASGRRWPALVATSALMLAEGLNLGFASYRYLMSANVVLAFVAAGRHQFRGRLPLLTLAAALLMALAIEPAQLAYALPGVAAIAALDWIRVRSFRSAVRGPLVVAAILAAGAVPLAILFWVFGMAPESIAYYLRLGDTVQYAALPTSVPASPWPDFPLGSVVTWWPAATLAIGLVELRRRPAQTHVRAAAIVGLSVLSFMVLQKHLVRPVPDPLMLYGLVIGLAFSVLSPTQPISKYRIGFGAAIGMVAALLLFQGRLGTAAGELWRQPSRAVSSIGTLVSPSAIAAANADRFAPERFASYRAQRVLVDELQRRLGRPVRVFALSDDPILYVLTGQAPVWHSNLYNGSPVYEQRKIIELLSRNPPDFVVAQPGRLIFDEVPVAVRAPDVVAFVIEHFVPDAAAPPYQVLRPRRDGETVPFAFWQELLGPAVNLGHLPAEWARVEREPCQEGADCDDLLVLIPHGPPREPIVGIDLTAGDFQTTLRLRVHDGQDRYVIPISRLWPYVLIKAAGRTLDVTVPAGYGLERHTTVRRRDRLY